jgi:hypothetical protein
MENGEWRIGLLGWGFKPLLLVKLSIDNYFIQFLKPFLLRRKNSKSRGSSLIVPTFCNPQPSQPVWICE